MSLFKAFIELSLTMIARGNAMSRLALAWIFLTVLIACSKNDESNKKNKTVLTAQDERCVLRVGVDPYEPFQYVDSHGQVKGINPDLIAAMAGIVHCDIHYVDINSTFEKILADIKNGDVDMVADGTPTPERERYAYFSKPVRRESFFLYIRAGEAAQWRARTIEEALSIRHMKIGVVAAYYYGEEIERFRHRDALSTLFVEAEASSDNFVNLLNGSVDGVLEEPYVAATLMQREKWQTNVNRHGLALHGDVVSLVFSRATVSKETVDKFNSAIDALRANGRYQEIMSRLENRSLDYEDSARNTQ